MNVYSRASLLDVAGAVEGVGEMLPRSEGGSDWHSGATLRAVGGPESEGPRNAKTPAKPGNSGTSQGSKAERLRSESNRRWRICNPASRPENPEENADSGEVPMKVPMLNPADRDLAVVVEAWSSLPPAVRAGIRAMVEASR
ncbi:MAG: hypothetical protein RLZZ326_3182 [Planctomycetota bacterium]